MVLNGGGSVAAAGGAAPEAAATSVTGKLLPLQRVTAAPGGPTPKAGGTLVYAVVSVDDRFDPADTTFTFVRQITAHVCEPLVWELGPGRYYPALAESWTVA